MKLFDKFRKPQPKEVIEEKIVEDAEYELAQDELTEDELDNVTGYNAGYTLEEDESEVKVR